MKLDKQQIYYSGTPSCHRYGSSTRIFDDFSGQYCDWKEDPLNKKNNQYIISVMPIKEVYKKIVDNNLIDALSKEGKLMFDAYETSY